MAEKGNYRLCERDSRGNSKITRKLISIKPRRDHCCMEAIVREPMRAPKPVRASIHPAPERPVCRTSSAMRGYEYMPIGLAYDEL